MRSAVARTAAPSSGWPVTIKTQVNSYFSQRGRWGMAREIVTTVEVRGEPERVWEVLTDFEHWPEWNPAMLEFTGRAAPGERLRFRVRSPEGGGAVTLKPTVLAAEPGRLLRWRGHFMVPGLFDATHEFVLDPIPGGTRVTQRERVSGVLIGLMSGVIARTERDNARADAGLKQRVEGAPA